MLAVEDCFVQSSHGVVPADDEGAQVSVNRTCCEFLNSPHLDPFLSRSKSAFSRRWKDQSRFLPSLQVSRYLFPDSVNCVCQSVIASTRGTMQPIARRVIKSRHIQGQSRALHSAVQETCGGRKTVLSPISTHDKLSFNFGQAN